MIFAAKRREDRSVTFSGLGILKIIEVTSGMGEAV